MLKPLAIIYDMDQVGYPLHLEERISAKVGVGPGGGRREACIAVLVTSTKPEERMEEIYLVLYARLWFMTT